MVTCENRLQVAASHAAIIEQTERGEKFPEIRLESWLRNIFKVPLASIFKSEKRTEVGGEVGVLSHCYVNAEIHKLSRKLA